MTPLLEITKLGFFPGARVFAKCENHNQVSFSHYDRVYDRLFDLGIARESIVRGQTHLFETSSGNAGTAFARYCQLYGLDGTIVFPSTVRKERLASIQSKRVNVVVSEFDGYMKGALKTVVGLLRDCKQRGGDPLFLNHSQTWESVIAMKTCGQEICGELDHRGIRPDYFVSALGNGTSTSGIGIPLKSRYPNLKILGFEPASSPVFSVKAGLKAGGHYSVSPLTGTGVWGVPFPNLDLGIIDQIELVDDQDTDGYCWDPILDAVAGTFGESIGPTSGAAVHVARQLAQRSAGKNIVIVFYDVREYYR